MLNLLLTAPILIINLGFEALDTRGGYPQYKKGKYTITIDDYGFWLDAYDGIDGIRISRINDISGLGLTFQK